MCVIDWGIFWNAVSAIANVALTIIAIVAARFAWNQIRVAEHTRATQVLLQANSDIQTYRNCPTIRIIRGKLLELLKNHTDPEVRLRMLLTSSDIDTIREFMARTNNLCWMILSLSDDLRKNLLPTINQNLALEWKCLMPLIEHRRNEKGDGDWYMHQFEQVVRMIEESCSV
ncbi:MAG: hypothetical protein WC762_12525 [Methylobacter sp.]|jgi:hypothetical protein